MDFKTYEKEIQAPQPAVTEKRVVLDLSEHEARVLRALYGKICPVGDHYAAIEFLSKLNKLFPNDAGLSSFGGISTYRVVKT